MLGEFVTRVLVLVLGYAYPAFECFKMMEGDRVEMHQLRFWCQYWVIVALVTVLERLGDIFISWMPLYGEVKIAFYIYLWYPKTLGASFFYETFLRPFFVTHEPEIEQRLQRLRVKSLDLLMFYIKNFTSKGQSMFLEVLYYIMSQPNGGSSSNKEKKEQPAASDPPRNGLFRRAAKPKPGPRPTGRDDGDDGPDFAEIAAELFQPQPSAPPLNPPRRPRHRY